MNLYESPKLVAEYLLFHFGDEESVLGNMPGPREAVGFAQRLVQELLTDVPADARALDVGCAVGGSSFELARCCRSVCGVDFSNAFIKAGRALVLEGELAFEKVVEGSIMENDVAKVDPSVDRSRVSFDVADACSLPVGLGPFDVVLAANLICRLPEPGAFLERLPELMREGGQLLLTTPFTWMEDHTPQAHWIGATPEAGRSFEALQSALAPSFVLEHTTNIPFLIREHSRKFQYTVAFGSRWRKR